MDLVTVYTAINPMDSDLIISRLSAAGFHPVQVHGLAATSGFVLAEGGIRVQVPVDEADEACRFLSDSEQTPPA